MESILLSMRPVNVKKLTEGTLTIDIRKTRIRINPPFKIYIYCTKTKRDKTTGLNRGYVLGECTCTKVHSFPFNINEYKITSTDLSKTGMSYLETYTYGMCQDLFGLELSQIEIYDTPKPLSDFCYAYAPEITDLDEELCKHCYPTDYGEHKEYHTPNGVYMCEGKYCADTYESLLEDTYMISHPPRSWCRVKLI